MKEEGTASQDPESQDPKCPRNTEFYKVRNAGNTRIFKYKHEGANYVPEVM